MQNTDFFSQNTESFFMGCTGLLVMMSIKHGYFRDVKSHNKFLCYLPELLQEADGGDLSEVHNKCREEHEQLREEFERYKLRAQSVLKNIATKVRAKCAFKGPCFVAGNLTPPSRNANNVGLYIFVKVK